MSRFEHVTSAFAEPCAASSSAATAPNRKTFVFIGCIPLLSVVRGGMPRRVNANPRIVKSP
jgi:hypothetical protein